MRAAWETMLRWIRQAILEPTPEWECIFNGSISQIRLWEDMKTKDEIQEGIEKEIQGDEAGLMHCWILNGSDLEFSPG